MVGNPWLVEETRLTETIGPVELAALNDHIR